LGVIGAPRVGGYLQRRAIGTAVMATEELALFANDNNNKTFKCRNYVFTKNNYTQDDLDMFDTVECKYLVYGKEVAPTTGTPHLQGFISFKNPRSPVSVTKEFKCWAKAAKTVHAAIEYCKKGGDITERGTPPLTQEEKGKEGEEFWFKVRLSAEEGRFDDIPEKVRFYHQKIIDDHHNKALRARDLPDTEVQHLWYYGAAGTGKSRKAREDHPNAYLKMCNKWWDGYLDHETVLIEDFDKCHSMLGHHLKIWADRYKFPAEIKGSSMVIRPKLVIVTSNYQPSDIWQDQTTLEPILRRFKVVRFGEVDDEESRPVGWSFLGVPGPSTHAQFTD